MPRNTYATLGRLVFALSLAGFGLQYVRFGHFAQGLPPIPPWTGGGEYGAYVVGLALLATSASIAASWKGRVSAMVVGFLFLLSGVLLHTQKLHDILYSGTSRTGALEVLGLAGAAFVLAAELPAALHRRRAEEAIQEWARLGCFLFAFTLVIFGLQHFWDASFAASLIPAWLPGRLFLTYLTGVGLIAAGLSVALGIAVKLSATLLAATFFLWVAILQGPRVAAHPGNGDEWSSAFVALAMCGASLIVAGRASRQAVTPHPVRRFSASPGDGAH